MRLSSIRLPSSATPEGRKMLNSLFEKQRIKRFSRITVMRKIKSRPRFKIKRADGYWTNKLKRLWNNRGY